MTPYREVSVSLAKRKILVGRKQELRQALKALSQKKHLLVSGPFGIGKTAFAREVIFQAGFPMLEVSLKKNPRDMAVQLVRGLMENKIIKGYPPSVVDFRVRALKKKIVDLSKPFCLIVDDLHAPVRSEA